MDSNVAKGAVVKKQINRTFQNSWLDEEIFKGWLAPHSELNKALCTACNVSIACRKTNLLKHSQTVKHIDEMKGRNQSLDNVNNISHRDKIKRAEIKLAAFFAEHNIAFTMADHLIPLMKTICLEPKIVQDLSLGRLKCSYIVKDVLAKRETEKLIEILKIRKFSILIDESTDITETKFMCVLVRYVSPIDKKVKIQLLELLCLDATDCSAKKIFEIFKTFFLEKEIPLKNIIGMASDNASVMIGRNNSFYSHLKFENPNLIMLNCICHSCAIIASKSCEKLPQNCENLIRGVATYMSGSAKRSAILQEFQDFFNVERNKILKLCNTRWLVLQKCVVRLLDNWNVLQSYFTLATVEDQSKSAEHILTLLNDDTIKAYLLFLKYSLNFFNSFNALFQSRQILIHKLFITSNRLINQIAQNFIIPEALNNIAILNIDDEGNTKDLTDIFVGPECEKFLTTQSLEFTQQIKCKCLDFYKTSLKEMMKRLPYKDAFFEQLNFLEPKVALYIESRNKFKDLSDIAAKIENIDISKLAFEWRILPTVFDDDEKSELINLEIENMWQRILNVKDFDEEKMFPNLELLVESVLSLPHSNAEAERIFSIVTDVKCKKRNRLGNDTISAICKIRSHFQSENINCINFEPDSRHFEFHNTQNLYPERK